MFKNYKGFSTCGIGCVPLNSDSAILMHFSSLRGDITAVYAVCCTRSSGRAHKGWILTLGGTNPTCKEIKLFSSAYFTCQHKLPASSSTILSITKDESARGRRFAAAFISLCMRSFLDVP